MFTIVRLGFGDRIILLHILVSILHFSYLPLPGQMNEITWRAVVV